MNNDDYIDMERVLENYWIYENEELFDDEKCIGCPYNNGLLNGECYDCAKGEVL